MPRFVAILLLVISCATLGAREVDVRGVAIDDATVARLQTQIEPSFDVVYNKTGLADDHPLQLVIVGGANSFADLAARDGVGMNAESVLGYAIPGKRKLVLNISGIRDRQLDPIGVLRHEIAHLVMGSTLRTARPLWFEEGVAQYVESMTLNELIEAQGANPWVEFSSLADLDAALREEARAGQAYSEAREVIRLIVAKYGEKNFFRFMKLLEKGETPFDKAFEDTTGATLADFEPIWLADRKERSSARMAGFFGSTLWWILLGITALVIPLAVVLRRMRGKSQVDHWEEVEKYFPSDPSWSYTDDEPDGFTPEDPDDWQRK